MATEKQCELMVERLNNKIKRLQGEIEYRRLLKTKWQRIFKELKEKAKQNARFPLDSEKRITKKGMTSCLAGSTKKKA